MCGKKAENKFEITMTVRNDYTLYDTMKSPMEVFTELFTKSHDVQYCVDLMTDGTCFVMPTFHIICLETGI